MSDITFHKAALAEVADLVDNRIAFALEFSGDQPVERINALRDQLTAYFTAAVADNSCISFLAKIDGKIAGIGSVHLRDMPGNFKNPSGKWGYIMNMYTKPVYRRKGVCKGLLNKLVEEASEYGITGFELHATSTGELVYKQEGFVVHHEPTYRKFIW